MLEAAPDTVARLVMALVRFLLIVLVLVAPLLMRLAKQRKTATPPVRPKASPLGEALREVRRQSAEQARARREGPTEITREADALRMSERMNLPPTIEPESSFFPSLLLLALLVCLGVMAYRYFAG
jgi:hypothetical protein